MSEKFVNNWLKNYGLCPSHYMSAPAFNWNAMLNMKKSETRTFSRSRHVHILWKRYDRWNFLYFSNNKYLKSYHPKQESKHIIYLGANNLYGYAMSKSLPQVDSNG